MSEIEVKSHTVVVAIPHRWLRQVVERIFTPAQVECICVENIEELYKSINGNTALTIVDVFSYSQYYRDIFTQLKEVNSGLSIVALVSESNKEYQYELTTAGASAIVIKENADEELIPALVQVLRDREFNDAVARLIENQKQFITLIKEEVNSMEKESGNIFGRRFGRRSFLKGSAAAAAVAGVAVASPGNTVKKALAINGEAGAPEKDEIFYGACRANCQAGCALKVKVRNDKVVHTEMAELPRPQYNRHCLRGLSHVQLIYNPQRLKYPMRRVGERGAGQWERITWEEAIQEITSKWKQYQQESGNNSIAFSPGSGNPGKAGNLAIKLQGLMGASSTNQSFDNSVLVTGPKLLGFGQNFCANDVFDIAYAKTIIIWGANPTEAQPQNMHFIFEAKKKGAKIIVIDPVYNKTASKAHRFVPIKPGTDAALAMAMMNVAIEKGYTDEEFIKSSTVGPFLVKASNGKFLRLRDLAQAEGEADEIVSKDAQVGSLFLNLLVSADFSEGDILVNDAQGNIGPQLDIVDPVLTGTYEINGIKATTAYELLKERIADWTPQKASQLCEVPIETIYELTELYAKNTPATLYAGFGPNNYNGSHAFYHAAVTLAALTGNLGKKGASMQAGFYVHFGFPLNSSYLATPGATPGPDIPAPKVMDVVNEGKYGDTPVNLRSLYIYKHNLLGNQSERKTWLEIFDKMDLVVVADMAMTDTVKYADIVLPVAHWFEVDDVISATSPFIKLQEKAIEPLYEAKNDYDIFDLLGKAMGYTDQFYLSYEEYLESHFHEPNTKAYGYSLQYLREKKIIDGSDIEHYIHGESGKFPTSTGRVEFYLENPGPLTMFEGTPTGEPFDVEKERLPYWEPPHEAWHENPLFEKYPLIYSQEKNKTRTQSMFFNSQWLLELYPEPIVKMSTKDATSRGIKDGDVVKVVNDRGYVVLKAVVDAGVRPGMVVVPKGWQTDQFIDGHYQDLTSRYMHPAVYNNYYFDALCEVEKM